MVNTRPLSPLLSNAAANTYLLLVILYQLALLVMRRRLRQ